jgi:hypothetical protein
MQGANGPHRYEREVTMTNGIYILLLLTAIGLLPGGSSPTLVQTKIKIHKTITKKTTKHKNTQNNKITTKPKDKYTNRTQ